MNVILIVRVYIVLGNVTDVSSFQKRCHPSYGKNQTPFCEIEKKN